MVLLALMVIAALLGALFQRRPNSDRLRRRLWTFNWVVLLPLAATYAFLSVEMSEQLLLTIAVGVFAWWITLGISLVVATTVAGSRPERAALALAGAFPNTGFVGFPLAHMAYGTEGLQLAVIYDQVSLVIPAVVIATVIARRDGSQTVEFSMLAQIVRSPPVWAVVCGVLLRTTVVHDPLDLTVLGSILGAVVGPVGFFLLGLSVPLEPVRHSAAELARIVAACTVRIGVAPLAVWVTATAAGLSVPSALLLIAAMPTAFHTLVISRLYDTRPDTVRTAIIITTPILVVAAALIG